MTKTPLFPGLMLVLAFAIPIETRSAVSETVATTTPNISQPAASSMPDRAPALITEYRLPPDKLAKSSALYHTQAVMLVVDAVYGIVVLTILLMFGVGARLRDWAERASSSRFVQAIIFAPLLLLTIDALGLPLRIYGHHLQLGYGLSVQGWGSWFWDWSKGEFVGTVIATLLIWGLYAFLRRSPTRWWFYFWLASIPFLVVFMLIRPVFIDPLFNKFEPLETKQPQLIPELEKVMHRGGLNIERARMFEMQASDKVTTYNAYVTGIGASKRVVVWDNTSDAGKALYAVLTPGQRTVADDRLARIPIPLIAPAPSAQ